MTRKLSKLMLLLLAMALVFALASATALADGFADVDENDWFYESVQYAVDNGLMYGTGSDLFSPNDPTTRAMIVTILHRTEGEPDVEGEPPFSDTIARSWYIYGVMWANDNGIVKGYPDGTFKPDAEITREQFATILYRYCQYKGYDVSKSESIENFPDAGDTHKFAETAMKWACAEGLITGKKNGGAVYLAPLGTATRAEVAMILMRFCER